MLDKSETDSPLEGIEAAAAASDSAASAASLSLLSVGDSSLRPVDIDFN